VLFIITPSDKVFKVKIFPLVVAEPVIVVLEAAV